MNLIDKYIFRTTFGAFTLIVTSLTAFIWVTQALREIDLMTNQGQSVLVFVGVTGLLIPMLVLIIAPVAFIVAVTYVLNKLNADSEMIVMSAAGMSPWRLFVPFIAVAFVVALIVAFIAAYLGPKGIRELRSWAGKLRADIVTRIVKPGRFVAIDKGLTIHIRERRPNGELLGVFLDDRRDPQEGITFLAERGEILDNTSGTFLLLNNGSVQRRQTGQRDPTIVLFERYAFDLSRFQIGAEARFLSQRERYLWDLMSPDPEDFLTRTRPGIIRAELHDRLVAPLYPLVFAILAYAFLGTPATTRQSRAFALVLTVTAVATLRFIGFGSTIFAVQRPGAVLVLYGSVVVAIVIGAVTIWRGVNIEPPAVLLRARAALVARLMRGAGPS